MQFYSLGFFDGLQYSYYRSIGSFLNDILIERYNGWRFFAHFGGRFDVHFIFDYLRTHKPDLDLQIICAGSCVICMSIRQGEKVWKFTDSYRLLPRSLKTLCIDFDVQHKKLDFNPTSMEYNRNDCLGLYECLEIFFNEFGFICDTLASQAMQCFRRRWLKRSFYGPGRDIEEFVRMAYTGGRCELYRYDESTLEYYDINSMYPFCMLAPVPTEYIGRTRALPDDDTRIGFYYARIDAPENYYPVLPVRLDKLYFPYGRFTGYFTSIELREAIEQGYCVSILSGISFHAEPILAEFSENFYRQKLQAESNGNRGLRHIYKSINNSLYGKFGQRRERKTYMTDRGQTGVYPLPNGLCYKLEEAKHCGFMLPQIAATITSRARLEILSYLGQCQAWYTDTDSVFTSTDFKTGFEIGQLQSKGKGKFAGFAAKEYKFGSAIKVKGLLRQKEDEQEDEFLARAYEFYEGEQVEFSRVAGFTESVKKGLPTARIIKAKKQHTLLSRDKRCRIGNDSRPWNINELIA